MRVSAFVTSNTDRTALHTDRERDRGSSTKVPNAVKKQQARAKRKAAKVARKQRKSS